MAIEVISQNDGGRINHKVYGDVYNVTYAKAIITEFETIEIKETRILRTVGPPAEVFTYPFVDWEFTDRVKLDIYGEWIPLFYHCKLHCYDEDIASLRDNGALTGSAYAFQIGDEVKVLLEEGVPKYVIGHADGKVTMGTQYFKMSFTDNNYFAYSNQRIEEDSIKETPTDYYGNEPNCDQLGEMMSWAFWYGVTGTYWQSLDYYIKVGPVLYVFWISAITYFIAGVFTQVVAGWRVFSGVWSEELVAKCKAVFDEHISLSLGAGFPAGDWSQMPIFQVQYAPVPPYVYPYPPEMKEQKYYSFWRYDDLGIERQPGLGIFVPAIRYFTEMPLYFDKVKFEGQSYEKQ